MYINNSTKNGKGEMEVYCYKVLMLCKVGRKVVKHNFKVDCDKLNICTI